PGGKGVAAGQHDRTGRPVSERFPGQGAADRRPAHPGHDQAAGSVVRLQGGRLHPPQRIAQLVWKAQDVIDLPRPVDCVDRLTSEVESRAQNRIAPSGSSTPGKIRAPAASVFPDPILTPAPRTTPPSMRHSSPMLTPGPTIDAMIVVEAPTAAPSSTTD